MHAMIEKIMQEKSKDRSRLIPEHHRHPFYIGHQVVVTQKHFQNCLSFNVNKNVPS